MEQAAESGLNFLRICYPMEHLYSEVQYVCVCKNRTNQQAFFSYRECQTPQWE